MVPSSYDLNSRWNTAIVGGLGPPDLIHMRPPCAIPGISVRGWVGGIVSVIFCLQTVRAQVWPDRSKLFEIDGISDFFFHKHFLETKAPIRPAVRGLVWAFVVPTY